MVRKAWNRVGLAMVLVVSIVLVTAPPSAAATLTVNTTVDEYGAGADCSLREAIQSINSNSAFGGCPTGAAGDTIDLPPGVYTLDLTGEGENLNATGDLDLMAEMTIAGSASSDTEIVGSGDRVMELRTGTDTTVTIRDVTVRGGAPTSGVGGGIYISDRQVGLDLERVVVGPNSAAFGGGLWLAGDAPAFPAIVTIRDSTISGNTTPGEGGGMVTSDATVTVERSLISENLAATWGDGISNYGSLTVRDSTIADNGSGAVGDLGGGIYSQSATTLENVTLFDNEGGASPGTGAHIYQNGGTLTVRNVLMDAVAFGGECGNIGSGTYVAQGTNLVESPGSCTDFTTATDLGLGVPGEEGGPTETVPITAGSGARGAAGEAFCGPTDQRGVPRPDGGCDVGAYQYAECRGRVVSIVGTGGRDILSGSAAAEGFLLLGGNDVANGGGGDDAICGGAGADVLKGGAGRDTLDGQGGKDRCNGGTGRDKGFACERQRSIP